jgi:hypothetical protein
MEVSCQRPVPTALIPGKTFVGTHGTENSVGPRTGLDAVEFMKIALFSTVLIEGYSGLSLQTFRWNALPPSSGSKRKPKKQQAAV